jgi:hypothetical protein
MHESAPFRDISKASVRLSSNNQRFSIPAEDNPQDVQCAAQCAREVKAKMDRELPNYQQQDSKMGGEYDPEKLDKLCSVHDATKTCLNNCPNTKLKVMIEKATALGQYMCHDSSFKQNAPCLNEVHKAMNARCENSSQCGRYKTALEEYKSNKPTDSNGLKDMMKHSCLYMQCALNCASGTIKERCGESAQNDLKGLVKKSVEFLKYTVESMGLNSVYPAECDTVTVNA